MIVSAPAHAALHLPVVPLATSSDLTGSNASANTSKTSPFKNVFDSLTLSEDPTHEIGAQEEGAAVPKSSIKKELTADQGSGTEETSVLPAPTVPQTPAPSLLTATLILPQAASGVAPDNNEVAEDATAQESASSNEQTDGSSTPLASLAPPSLSYSSLRYSSLSTQARLNVPGATSTKTAAKVTTSTPGKGSEKAGQQLAPAVSEPTDPGSSTLTSVPGKSVSNPAEPLTAQAVPEEPETALPAAKFPIRETAVAAQPSTRWTIEEPAPAHVTALRDTRSAKAPASSETPASATLPTPVGATPPSGPANVPAMILEQSPSADQTATPAPPSAPDTTSPPPANVTPQKPARAQAAVRSTSAADPAVAPSAAPSSTVSPAQSQPAPTLAAAAAAVSTTSPLPAAHEAIERASETSSSSSAIQHEASSTIPAPKIPLLPQVENFAFALRMLGPEGSPNQSSAAQTPVTGTATPAAQSNGPVTQSQSSALRQPAPDQSQSPSDPSRDAQPSAPAADKSGVTAQNPVDGSAAQLGPQQTPRVTSHWPGIASQANDAAVLQPAEIGSVAGAPEPAEAAHANLTLAAQEAHLLAPDMPKTPASSEILLHLTGADQSSAAIRIADRAGSVNVSVHASDPVLRESLRSNLGDLSNQLSDQGWKADVSKSAMVATQSASQQDSHESGQRGSHQQQSFGGDRQPQRDRRTNGGQWQQELDQQTSGGDALSGGN